MKTIHKLIACLLAIMMILSSTVIPIKTSVAYALDEKGEIGESIDTIMDTDSVDDIDSDLPTVPTPETINNDENNPKDDSIENEDIDLANQEVTEQEQIIEKSEYALLYEDETYQTEVIGDIRVKITGLMPENGSVKAYLMDQRYYNLADLAETKRVLALGFEIFDKDGNIYEKNPTDSYEIEIDDNDLFEIDTPHLFEKSINSSSFIEKKDFIKNANRFLFDSNASQFIISKDEETSIEEDSTLEVEDKILENTKDKAKQRNCEVQLDGLVDIKESHKILSPMQYIESSGKVDNPLAYVDWRKELVEAIVHHPNQDKGTKADDLEEGDKAEIDADDDESKNKEKDSSIDKSLKDSKDDENNTKLGYQQVIASIYEDQTYTSLANDTTRIKLSGYLPGYTKIKAYPVDIKIEGSEVLAAYDITIFDEDGEEYKVTADNKIKVQISNKKIQQAKKVEVYHKENQSAPEEKIRVEDKTSETVTFKADSFSIYAVTDPDAKAITFVFLNRNSNNEREVWDTQTVRNGEKLMQPELPIFSYKGKFGGWHYYDIETDTFGEKFDFDKPVTVTESSPKTIYLKGKYPDVAYINFIDRKEVENSDGSKSYVDEVLSTKEIPLGDTVTTEDVPVIPGESGTVFSHWALKPDSREAFDFNTPITKEYIQSVQGADNFVRLDLYAVFKKALTVTFDSQGGTHVNKQVVYSGDKLSLNDLTKPVRPGYDFKYWSSSPKGRQFNANTPITKDMTLYAVWTPKVVKYTINHFMENADDNGYSLYKSETKTANAGTYTNADSSSYKLSNTIMNNEKIHFVRADERKIIRGDDSTEINLYYDRDTFTFRVFESYVLYEIDVVNVDLKWGADTKPYFEEALRKLPSGYTFKENGIGGQNVTSPPRMPKNNYQLLAWREGKNEWNVRIIDVETNQLIRLDAKTSRVSSSLQGYTGGELIPGYTYKYVERPGDDFARPSTRHADGKTSEQNEVWVYYQRNRHDLTFSTNGNGPDIIRNNILYDSSLAQYAPENYIRGQTKNSQGQIFAGWFENANGAGNPVDLKSMTMPDNNLKLYAKWEEPVYTVRAYKQRNNPEAGVIELKVKRGDTVDISKLSADKPPVAEQTQGSELRWYAFINGTLTEYNFSDPVYSDLFLYPVWLAPVGEEFRPLSQIYRVRYSAPQEDGTDYIYTDPNDYVNNAEAIVIPPYIDGDYKFPPDANNQTGTKLKMPKDKVFEGWVIDKNSQFTSVTDSTMLNKIYQPGDIINVIGNIMFKPVFNEYKITSLTLREITPDGRQLDDIVYEARNKPSDLPNGINDNRPTEDLRNNDTITLPQPSATNTRGFHFLGWSTTEDPTKGKIFKPDQEVMITDENMPNILYGIWERNKFKVTIKNNATGEDTSPDDNKFRVSYTLESQKYSKMYEVDNASSIDVEIPYGSTNIEIKSLSDRYVKYSYKGQVYNSDTLILDSLDGDIEVIFENQPIPPPTGLIDNLSPMLTLFILTITAFIGFVIYNKKKLGGTID